MTVAEAGRILATLTLFEIDGSRFAYRYNGRETRLGRHVRYVIRAYGGYVQNDGKQTAENATRLFTNIRVART